MSSTKSQVAVATNIPNLASGQQQKDYNTEESLGRQNSFGLNRRGNMKGKHLTRSHAMREATSPPRTPTPRASESSSQMSPNGYQQQQHHQQQPHMDVNEGNNNNNSNNKLHTQSSATRGNSPIIDTPTVIVTSQHKQQQQPQQHQQQQSNVALCNETEFPKLSPPKSKSGSNSSTGGSGGGAPGSGNSSSSSSSGVNSSCNNNPQRINNTSEGHNNNNNNTNSSNKKTNGDTAGVNNETHNKSTNNVNMNAGNANKNYNQSQQQQFSAGNALQKALNVTDNSQSTTIYNSPMNYQLHPNDVNREQQQQQSYVVYDKENRCPRNDSQNSMNSNEEMHYETQQQQQQQQQQHQQQHQQHQSQQHHQRTGGGKKHRTNSNSKGSKPRLKNMGSTNTGGGGGSSVSNMGAGGSAVSGGLTSGSVDGSLNSSNNTSGFISRVFTNSENSNEQYTDYGGTDLLSFFKETLNKNVKDRQFLLKVEKDLIEFVQEGNRGEIRFPQASSYNRMLIHRTAAFFGMEHNVDTETQQCVIVAPTKNTRIPEIRFKTLVINNRDDSRKSILKRDTHSFDEARQSSYLCPDRGGMLDRKAKSFEEREEDYDRARSRIFNRSQNEACPGGGGSTDDDNNYISWTSSVDQQQFSRGRPSGKVLKIQNSPDGRAGSVVQKSNNNFSNYSQGGAPLIRGDSANSNKSMGTGSGNGTRIFSKQDSAGSSNTSWRLSPSSSGYKTQTQSIRSDSVTPSPTGGYGSDEPHLPDHPPVTANREINEDSTTLPSGLVWAVTDISNVPKGSILINPQTLQPILNADGTVYHYDPSNMPPAQAMASGSNVANSGGSIYHTNQNNSPSQQHPMHNPLKKQHKGHQIQQQQQFNKLESATTGATNSGGETVSESSTQTINVGEEVIPSNNILDVSYQEDDLCNADENDECDNSANGCLSITTTTSTKNYDRIEVQKFKNQATSPNIPINEKDDIVKREHSSQTPVNVTPTQQSHLQQSQTPQQSQTQNRETPHSSRSTPFSNSDTLTKRSSEEPRATSWTQSYQAPDGSTVFHTTSTPNSSATNPYCTTTYQQGPDGSIYAVPQGMIYAYPPPVEGEFQGYFMPVFDPSQQRSDTTGLLQPGTQTIYPAGGATTMVPVAAYPTAQFATTNGAPIYPSQVIYSGEQFQTAGAPLTATAPASATAQLQQIPMTTYPIGYPYPYNGYWGQTMTYYVPQQAVPATSLLAAPPPPPSAPGNVSHVAGGVNTTGPNGGNSTAGPSTNSSNATNNSSGHMGNGNTPNTSHQNGSVTAGYQSHVHAVSGGIGSSHSGGTTYYGTGRIKRPTPPHFSNAGTNGGHQVLAAASIPNGVTTATYQLGHAVPTLTLAAAAPPQATAGAPTTTDLSGGAGAPTTATMYALPQHATIFPANMFPYATNAAAQAIGPQSGANMAPPTAIIQPPVNPQGHVVGGVGGQANATAGAIHNPHHSNTVITPFYTTTHHHAPHPGIQAGGHTIHAPGPSAIPIVDPATITNVTQLGPANNSVYSGRSGGASNNAGTSQSAPSTPHSMPSSSTLHHSQRNPSVFSTPPILNNNGSNYNSSNSTPHYYGNNEMLHQSSVNTGSANNSNSPHNSYVSSSYEKRNNANSGGGKKSLSYQSASLSRQNSTSGGGYNGSGKPSALINNANNNNDTRASPSSSTNSRPHSIKRGGGGGGGGGVSNDKPQTPLLSGPPSYVGGANIQNNNNSYQAIPNADMGTGNIPIVNVSKPPIRLNAAAAAFRQKGTTSTGGGGGSAVEYRRNPTSQRNSPGTNASSSNDNSNNNSPNSIHNSSNAATPIAAGCYAPSYMINAQNNGGEPAPTHPPSLYITTAPARGPAHIPPHLQSAAANGAAVPAAAAAATASVPQQAATAVLGGAAAAAAAADVANAAAVAAAAATVAHHHHHQPLLGTYNPGASGLYFKYGHTYFAHPSVALPNSRRSPSTDLRPPIAQMAGMYPTVNMMIPAQPRHPGRHPNPNYKGTRPR
ncbi:protein encore isoform X1 [Lucilia cuprina]|uniref:protein encore isoform X1 n=1 Tax=Lucilia cuprina TaxID=7375 RepID=UPI001F063957|nr:protein encore isoform X1 [Lucilia cuprina]